MSPSHSLASAPQCRKSVTPSRARDRCVGKHAKLSILSSESSKGAVRPSYRTPNEHRDQFRGDHHRWRPVLHKSINTPVVAPVCENIAETVPLSPSFGRVTLSHEQAQKFVTFGSPTLRREQRGVALIMLQRKTLLAPCLAGFAFVPTWQSIWAREYVRASTGSRYCPGRNPPSLP